MLLAFLDDVHCPKLYPFTRTRSAADIRCGILTLRERWEKTLGAEKSVTLTAGVLQKLYPATPTDGEVLLLNSRLLGGEELTEVVESLPVGTALHNEEGIFLAARLQQMPGSPEEATTQFAALPTKTFEGAAMLQHIWNIFSLNGAWIKHDFELLTHRRLSMLLPAGVITKKNEQIFLEEGAKIGLGVLLNAGNGPIYIGKNAEIMDGTIVRGPMALGEGAVVKMGAKIYGDTTIGPGCKVGGEITNAVFFANSNKGHDGYVGNCVVGEWCNIGADTNASNLKNNYDKVKIQEDATSRRVSTGLTFCGLLMGDHSKCGINTMFNTGTVAGVSCNIYGGDFPPAYIPSFSWGGAAGFKTYTLDKAIDAANRMMERRDKTLSEAERQVLTAIFEETAAQRAMHHAKTEKAAE